MRPCSLPDPYVSTLPRYSTIKELLLLQLLVVGMAHKMHSIEIIEAGAVGQGEFVQDSEAKNVLTRMELSVIACVTRGVRRSVLLDYCTALRCTVASGCSGWSPTLDSFAVIIWSVW